MVGMVATVHSAKKLELDMDRILRTRLEFEVREHCNKYAVVELLVDGTEIWYTGFPTRVSAEKFVLAQPKVWE